jgi:hypothetical protein
VFVVKAGSKGKEPFCRPLRRHQNFILAFARLFSFHPHLVLDLVLESQRRPSRSLFWLWMI